MPFLLFCSVISELLVPFLPISARANAATAERFLWCQEAATGPALRGTCRDVMDSASRSQLLDASFETRGRLRNRSWTQSRLSLISAFLVPESASPRTIIVGRRSANGLCRLIPNGRKSLTPFISRVKNLADFFGRMNGVVLQSLQPNAGSSLPFCFCIISSLPFPFIFWLTYLFSSLLGKTRSATFVRTDSTFSFFKIPPPPPFLFYLIIYKNISNFLTDYSLSNEGLLSFLVYRNTKK